MVVVCLKTRDVQMLSGGEGGGSGYSSAESERED